jgi:Fe-S cluster assembly protein SufD
MSGRGEATMSEATMQSHDFLTHFRERQQNLAGRGPHWLRRSRRDSLARFTDVGFPTTRQEEWRNTNVSPIAGTAFRPAADGPQPGAVFAEPARIELDGPRAVFVDGRFAPGLSGLDGLPNGVWVGGLAEALETIPDRLERYLTRTDPGNSPAFRALNSALSEDGGVVWIPEGQRIEAPIQLVFVTTIGEADSAPKASHPRTLVVAGESSQATILESYAGSNDGVYLTNAVTELDLAKGAVLDHYRVQLESERAYHISTVESRQGADSRYSGCHINLGGKLVRNEVRAVLAGAGGSCSLDGLYVTRGDQHLDNHTVLDHAEPQCDSREVFKGILGGSSRTVFSGRIVVRPDAQRTDAKQSNPNLVLGADALAQTRPQLEIYADDVKCTHGATIGRLDADAIFYLRSRGVSADEARNLLIGAFAGEILNRIRVEPLRRSLEATIGERLSGI